SVRPPSVSRRVGSLIVSLLRLHRVLGIHLVPALLQRLPRAPHFGHHPRSDVGRVRFSVHERSRAEVYPPRASALDDRDVWRLQPLPVANLYLPSLPLKAARQAQRERHATGSPSPCSGLIMSRFGGMSSRDILQRAAPSPARR